MITFERYHEFYKDTMALELFNKEYDQLGWMGKEYVNDMLGGKYIEASLAMVSSVSNSNLTKRIRNRIDNINVSKINSGP